MAHDILNSMRALREDMRQRLMQAPEYRALEALDRSIEEICDILRNTLAVDAPQAFVSSVPEAETVAPQARVALSMAAQAPQPQRQGAIATAFAKSLAARLDQRGGHRPGANQTPPTHRGG